jgi:hypothetical protein
MQKDNERHCFIQVKKIIITKTNILIFEGWDGFVFNNTPYVAGVLTVLNINRTFAGCSPRWFVVIYARSKL